MSHPRETDNWHRRRGKRSRYCPAVVGASGSHFFGTAALALAIPLAIFAYLAAGVMGTGRIRWDDDVADVVHRVVATAPIPFDGTLLIANPTIAALLVLAAVALTLLLRAQASYAIFWTAAVGSVFLLDPVLKALFRRPGAGGEYSFPSGTALFSAVAVAAIAFVLPTARLRAVVAVVGAAVSLSYGVAIVDVGWHYPSDVVAGWAFGLAWTTALWLAFFGRSRFPLA